MLTRAHHGAELKAHGLAAAPSGRRLFAKVDLHLKAGEALHITGPNGSGKTTLLRILSGLSESPSGQVHRSGGHLTYLGHAPALKDELTALENVRSAAMIAGLKVSDENLKQALARFGLASRTHLPARVLSQGQRRRVALARLAVPQGPGLLVLDEPFNALDAEACELLTRILSERLQEGSVLVYTTHQAQRLNARQHHTLKLGEPDTVEQVA